MRRQIVLTAATLVFAAGAVALLWWVSSQPVQTHYRPVLAGGTLRMRAVHEWHGAFALRLLAAELLLCAAIGHAARVIAFTFQRGR
jgi:hypothetical protein